mmetsp:Transcript_37768/g.122477  ORF Transcript_37768/g.122477 Transcript_37768/m.122477 type:complete len:144 (+) Transcript_37768:109-540(+)
MSSASSRHAPVRPRSFADLVPDKWQPGLQKAGKVVGTPTWMEEVTTLWKEQPVSEVANRVVFDFVSHLPNLFQSPQPPPPSPPPPLPPPPPSSPPPLPPPLLPLLLLLPVRLSRRARSAHMVVSKASYGRAACSVASALTRCS